MALFVSPAEYDAWCIKEAIYVSTVGKKEKGSIMCMWREGSWGIFRGFHLQFNFYCVSSLICIPCNMCAVSLLKSRE